MRFRGKLVDISCIQHFTRVMATMAKLTKVCTLRITKNKLYYIMVERAVNGGVSIWCEVTQGTFFNEYAMDGLSSEHDEIYLELVPDSVLRALKTAHNAKTIKVKLTKKQVPALTLEVELPTLGGHSRLVTHDIPVTVVPYRQWAECSEPEVPQFDVSLCLPPLKTLRAVLERMKNMSNHVTLSANQNGDLSVSVETELVNISTHFKDLQVQNWDTPGVSASPRDPAYKHQVRVDVRKLVQFLSSHQGNPPQRLIANIVEDHVLHIFLLHDDVSLQYFLPAVTV